MQRQNFLAAIPAQNQFNRTRGNLPLQPGLRYDGSALWENVNRAPQAPANFEGYALVDMDEAAQGAAKMYATAASSCIIMLLYDQDSGHHFLTHLSAGSVVLNGNAIFQCLQTFLVGKTLGHIDAYLFTQNFGFGQTPLDDLLELFAAVGIGDNALHAWAQNIRLITGMNQRDWNVYCSVRVNLGTSYVHFAN